MHVMKDSDLTGSAYTFPESVTFFDAAFITTLHKKDLKLTKTRSRNSCFGFNFVDQTNILHGLTLHHDSSKKQTLSHNGVDREKIPR